MVKHLYNNKKYNFPKKILSWLGIILHWIEVLIAILVIAFVLFSIITLVQSGTFTVLTGEDFYLNFEGVLSDILLIIIGIELAILLIRRSPESVLELMFFVVARSMLTNVHKSWEILIGVLAIAGLFMIRKYLEHDIPERQKLTVHTKETN
tara:strand:- start:1136 stop:1588 length:453 start_codon:yes stop_codon:yes gene_type:complete